MCGAAKTCFTIAICFLVFNVASQSVSASKQLPLSISTKWKLRDAQDGQKDFGKTHRSKKGNLLCNGGCTGSAVVSDPPAKALTDAHFMVVGDCLDSLDTNADEGLSSSDALMRLQRYGPNELSRPPATPLWKLVLEQFEDKLVQILLAVAVLSGVLAAFERDLHAFAEPFIILSILVMNAVVGIWQSKSAEDSLEALQALQPDNTCVLRDGAWLGNFPTSKIVPGDIIYLQVGDKVPADARVVRLKTNTFNADEGSLTGESNTVSKSADVVDAAVPISGKSNMVFGGTVITNGACYAVVTSTGAATEIGVINAGVQAAKEVQTKTPLGQKLDEFGDQLTIIIAAICVSVWLASIPKFSSPVFSSWFAGAVYYAKTAVALGVAAIPEGLPAVITLCLSLGTRRMAQRNVVVRKLSSVETLGCTSVICTDKTGTLTTNKMTVKALLTLRNAGTSADASTKSISAYRISTSSSELKSVATQSEEAEWDWESTDDASNTVAAASTAAVSAVPQLNEREVEGVSYDPIGSLSDWDEQRSMTSPALQMLSSICVMCNTAQINYNNESEVFERIGEPTEAALKVLAEKMGAVGVQRASDAAGKAHQFSDFWMSQFKTLSVLEFNRDRKSMSVLVRPTVPFASAEGTATASTADMEDTHNNVDNYLFVKGASEMVLQRCNRIELEDGTVVPLTDSMRSSLLLKLQEMAKRPLRCLALAYKRGADLGALNTVEDAESASALPQLQDTSNYVTIESELILVGCCGIKDPARPEAAEAILKCSAAGIRVMMITGDSKDTAVAIAKDVNIFDSETDIETSAFTGRDFFALDARTQLALLRSGNKVFCRAEPVDKQRLISMLTELDEIPAMTGDGVNDAPALQQAAIGVAMGIAGTEVAKGAADMILVDDNFASIVNAVEEGRNIYSNMQTFVCFLISCNIGEVVSVFLATILGLPEPLSPLQLLWVNLVTDGPPATALGFNPADPTAMQKQPRPRNESILSSWLLIRYLITGMYVGFATIGVFVWWFMDKGVTFYQLSHWGQCSGWEHFAHSADAPHWSSTPCNIFTGVGLHRPQALSLSVLVTIEMLKALSAVSLDSSLLVVQPWQNKWLISGVLLPFLLHFLVLYSPLKSLFGLAPLTWAEWKMVLRFALPIVALEEVLKLVGRRVERAKQNKLKNIKNAKAHDKIAVATPRSSSNNNNSVKPRGMPPPMF